MEIYLLYLLSIIIFNIFFVKKENYKLIFGGLSIKINRNKIYIGICLILIIILAGLRGDTIGADTQTYLKAIDYYEGIPKNDLISAKLIYPFDFEVGYFLLVKICAFFNVSKTCFLFIIAVIIYVPIFQFIEKKSEDSLLSILIYFVFGLFTYSLGIFRQMIAISICLYGLDYIKNEKLIRYIIVIFIASLIHQTAIIMIPFYFLYRFNQKKLIYLAFIMQFVNILFGKFILVKLFSFLPAYSHYINSIYDVTGGSYWMLILFNISMLFYYLYLKNHEVERLNRILMSAIPICVTLQSLAYSLGIFGRIVPYYSIYMIVNIPFFINNFTKDTNKYRWFIIILLFALSLYSISISKDILPYQFF